MQLRSGFSVKQTILRNIVSSFTLLIGAILSFTIGESSGLQLGHIYGGIAGFFIYIALSDIIPTIHQTEKVRYGLQTAFLIFGLVFGGTVATVAHDYIDVGHNHDHGHHDDHKGHDDHDEEGHDDHDEEAHDDHDDEDQDAHHE